MTYAQAEIKSLEDRILERMIEADELTAALKHADSTLASEKAAIDAARKALVTELADLKATLERIAVERAELCAQIDPKTLAVFELVASRRGGIGMAEARDGHCAICHVRLRPQVFNTIRRNDEILQCDSCGRVLYFVQRAPDAEGAAAQPAQ